MKIRSQRLFLIFPKNPATLTGPCQSGQCSRASYAVARGYKLWHLGPEPADYDLMSALVASKAVSSVRIELSAHVRARREKLLVLEYKLRKFVADLNLTIRYNAVHVPKVIVHLPDFGGFEVSLPSMLYSVSTIDLSFLYLLRRKHHLPRALKATVINCSTG
jgi:hypothetical protein